MKLIFVGAEKDDTEAAFCEAMGIVFRRWEETPVPGDVFLALSPNPAFKAVPGEAEEEPEPAEEVAEEVEAAPVAKRGRKKAAQTTPGPEAEAVLEGIE